MQIIDLRSLITFGTSPSRWAIAVRATLVVGLPPLVTLLTGHGLMGFATNLGGFAVLYATGTPVRRRVKVIAAVGLGLTLSAAVGSLVAHHPWLALIALTAIAGGAAWLTNALRLGPPGALFFVLSAGIATAAVGGGTSPVRLVGLAAVGALLALVIGCSDGFLGSRRAERAAVAAAASAVDAFRSAAEEGAEHAVLERRRGAASTALHAAWTAVTDGGPVIPPRGGRRADSGFAGELHRIHDSYVSTSASLAARDTGGELSLAHPQPWEPADSAVRGEVDPRTSDQGTAEKDVESREPERRRVERTQINYTSLGRPSVRYLLTEAAWWPSEPLLVAARVLGASLLAGVIATAIGNPHSYWAIAFAALIVQAGGSRRVQATKAVHRMLGTFAGLGIFALIARIDPSDWWLLAIVVVLQAGAELTVTRHYALAVTLLTPLALSVATAITSFTDVAAASDRLLDTVLGVGAAVVVLMLTGLGRHELLLRAHARRVATRVAAVLEDLADGTTSTPDGQVRRQHLYAELLDSDQVAQRALADAPEDVAPFREMERLLSRIAYLVLGAAWHEHAWGSRDRFARALAELDAVLAHPVTQKRGAEEITAELVAVERALVGAAA
ncbi:putative integral membrane protein [Actinomycetales bacterium JB111]|nr:putative integral membrane protein [Actinomycetales bacterium JB111]